MTASETDFTVGETTNLPAHEVYEWVKDVIAQGDIDPDLAEVPQQLADLQKASTQNELLREGLAEYMTAVTAAINERRQTGLDELNRGIAENPRVILVTDEGGVPLTTFGYEDQTGLVMPMSNGEYITEFQAVRYPDEAEETADV